MFSSHVTFSKQKILIIQIKCKLIQMLFFSADICLNIFFFLPRIRAAISLLFWEGMSLTVSRAVRPFRSVMFTSIPNKQTKLAQILKVT